MHCINCGAPLDTTSPAIECPYCGALNQNAPVVLAQSLRIETMNETASVMVPRWTALPTSFIAEFSTGMDNQQVVSVQILQGDGEKVAQNRVVGLFIFDGIPPAPRAVPRIQFTFEIDEAGVLLVTAENQGTGKRVIFPKMHLDILKKTEAPARQVHREAKSSPREHHGPIQFREDGQTCPKCGGKLGFSAGAKAVVCQYCGSRFYAKDQSISDPKLHGTVSIGILNGAAIPIVARGTRLPAEAVTSFSTATDYQESIDVSVVFGENHLTIDNIPIGTFSFGNIMPTLRGIPKIDIQIKIDENKLLTVTATEVLSGRQEMIGKVDISGLEVPPYRGFSTFSEDIKDEFRRRR